MDKYIAELDLLQEYMDAWIEEKYNQIKVWDLAVNYGILLHRNQQAISDSDNRRFYQMAKQELAAKEMCRHRDSQLLFEAGTQTSSGDEKLKFIINQE